METERDTIATTHKAAEASLRPLDKDNTRALLALLDAARQAAQRHLDQLDAPVVRLR